MRFDVVTLFPELFSPFLVNGVTRRAYESGLVEVRLWNPRDFAEGNYRRVDDRPFGGGPGMVMLAEPLALCLENILADSISSGAPVAPAAPVVLFSPVGETLTHAGVESWSSGSGAVLVCGRYEGLDQRLSTPTLIARLVWATSCCRAARLLPWPCWMPWRGCSRVC